MTDQPQTSHQTTVTALNVTPLSQHLAKLLGPTQGLTLKAMAFWVTDNLADRLNQEPEEIDQSLANWEMTNPQALYDNLEDPELVQATTLEQAGETMLEILNEIYQPLRIRDANLAQ